MANPRNQTGSLGLVLAGLVVVAVVVIFLSGGLATKSVEGDQDLPPVTSPAPAK
ncbi:MAG: hypothetical protein M5U07_26295 [Xanthobacteraceae bacterium]|nr:hypothetical protein [Xanthobacteraceae bacterium]